MPWLATERSGRNTDRGRSQAAVCVCRLGMALCDQAVPLLLQQRVAACSSPERLAKFLLACSVAAAGTARRPGSFAKTWHTIGGMPHTHPTCHLLKGVGRCNGEHAAVGAERERGHGGRVRHRRLVQSLLVVRVPHVDNAVAACRWQVRPQWLLESSAERCALLRVQRARLLLLETASSGSVSMQQRCLPTGPAEGTHRRWRRCHAVGGRTWHSRGTPRPCRSPSSDGI